jgi:hypothetical protein
VSASTSARLQTARLASWSPITAAASGDSTSYANESLAIESAGKLARQLSEREVWAAAMTNERASEYAAAMHKLAPFNVRCCLPLTPQANDGQARRRCCVELLAVKEARGASGRYLQDLRSRLNRFAESFQKNAGDVTTAEISAWFDAQKKLAPQMHSNFRRVIHPAIVFHVPAIRRQRQAILDKLRLIGRGRPALRREGWTMAGRRPGGA